MTKAPHISAALMLVAACAKFDPDLGAVKPIDYEVSDTGSTGTRGTETTSGSVTTGGATTTGGVESTEGPGSSEAESGFGPACGDEVAEGSEECDGSDLNGWTCFNLGMAGLGGNVVCNDDCTLNNDHCATPNCGDPQDGLYGGCQHVDECEANVGPGSICFTTGSWGPICTVPCTAHLECTSPVTEGCGSPSYCDDEKGVCLLDCSVSGVCPPGMSCTKGVSDTGHFCA